MSPSLRSRPSRTPSERPTTSGGPHRRRRKRRLYEKETKDPLSSILTVVVLFMVFLGYREYQREQQQAPQTQLRTPQEILKPLSRDEDIADDGTRYHVVFSTDCSPYQHWQSYLVFFSAFVVKQPGHVTRIASGCTEQESQEIKKWFEEHVKRMSSRFHLHLTPHFSGVKSSDGQVVGDYKFFNKPFGLLHWMENADPAHFSLTQEDDVVILIDPDMALMRPLVGDFSDKGETIISPKRQKHLLATRVQHGIPFAQTYGLGTQWETFDLDKIAGADSPAKLVSKEEGFLYYPAGPPYLATVKDTYAIAKKWTEFVPHVHEQYPHLLAEMFAFCIAAADLGLKHQLIDSLMVSNTGMDGGEGLPLVDKIPVSEICDFASNMENNQYAVPSVVHLCQRYAVGDEWFFGKHRVPQDVYSCERPLFEQPPSNVALLYDFKKSPNQKERKLLTEKQVKREAFMVCFLTSLLNNAASFYKQGACPPGTANLEKTLKMTDLFSEKERSR